MEAVQVFCILIFSWIHDCKENSAFFFLTMAFIKEDDYSEGHDC